MDKGIRASKQGEEGSYNQPFSRDPRQAEPTGRIKVISRKKRMSRIVAGGNEARNCRDGVLSLLGQESNNELVRWRRHAAKRR